MNTKILDFDKSKKFHLVMVKRIDNSILGILINVLSVVCILTGLFLFLSNYYADDAHRYWMLALGMGLLINSINLFINNFSIPYENSQNLADKIALEVHIAWQKSKNKNPQIIYFLNFLLDTHEGIFISEKLLFDTSVLLEFATSDFKNNILDIDKIHNEALNWSEKFNKKEITVGDYLLAYFNNSPALKQWLKNNDLSINDVANVAQWWMRIDLSINSIHNKRARWFNIDPITKEWSMGYTNILSVFAFDLNKYVRTNINYYHVYGRKNEIELLENALSTSSNANALLIGPPGVGKSAVVFGLTYKIINNISVRTLNGKRVFQLSSAAIFNGIDNISQAENRLIKILENLVSYGNGILFIENIQNFFDSSNSKVGAADFSDIILPYLSGSLQIIGSVSLQGFHATIGKNQNLLSLFHKININEPTDESSELILEDISSMLQARNNAYITYEAIKAAVKTAKRYLHDIPMPEKAIQLLESATLEVVKGNQELVTRESVNKAIELQTNIPIGDTTIEENQKLIDLENQLHKYIIGQDEAISAIANALRRGRIGLTKTNRPIGSFLFLGPTGVGKTETSKALARVYFGQESAMIRLDMSEYQELSSIQRLIGENGKSGFLTDAVHDNPYSLILLEELEKANKDLLNIFLQVLEDGRLTDGLGRTVDFSNTIIIATSNAGSDSVQRLVVENITEQQLEEKIIHIVIDQGIFRPEFINRFDGVIIFQPLNSQQIRQITQLMLLDIVENLREKQIEISFSDDLVARIASNGIHPEFGARPLRRYIQDHIENRIATMLLNGRLKSGEKIQLTVADIY